MADVFISYSKSARGLTESCAAELESRGLTVWWDKQLSAGDVFRHEIRQEIAAAKAVVVIWSQPATKSNWVYAEAALAARTGKLVSLAAADVTSEDLPLPFGVFHLASLIDRDDVLRAVRARISGALEPAATRVFDDRWQGFWLLDPKQNPFDPRDANPSPSALLLAKHALVPFLELRNERRDMLTWARAEGDAQSRKSAAGRLLHGPGGFGKTRLMIEVCAALADEGWLAGFVPPNTIGKGYEWSEAKLRRLIEEGQGARPLLLVVDYAEGRRADVQWLVQCLLRRRDTGGTPARIVLLSRAAGEWWKLLFGDPDVAKLFGRDDGAADLVSLLLAPEDLPPERRLTLFVSSVDALGSVLRRGGRSTPVGLPSKAQLERIRTGADYTRPLAIQMEAVLHLYGEAPGAHRMEIAGLLDRILELETQHWSKRLNLGDDRAGKAVRLQIERGVAQVTLVAGVGSKDDAKDLLKRDDYDGARSDGAAQLLHGELHALFGSGAGALVPLEPDLIGEHHIAAKADDRLVDACLDWAGEDAQRRRAVLTVLNRATRAEHGPLADRPAHRLRRLIATRGEALGGDLVAVAWQTTGRLLDLCPALAEQVDGFEEEGLAAIDGALPLQSEKLFALSLRVAERRAELARRLQAAPGEYDIAEGNHPTSGGAARVAILDHLSARLATLGIRLGQAGRREEALAVSQEAVDIYRRLAEARPDDFLPNLAASLSNLGIRLSNLGRREEALTASQEAVDIRRSLAEARPDDFLSDLATSLNNLGRDLSNLGRREEALAASQEAVDIRRRLAEARPDAFLPDLARSLNNTGPMLFDLGRREEALATSQEAVDIYRSLVEARPDAFLPEQAAGLNNIGVMLSDLGRHEEALAAGQEAVDIRRRLAEARPDAFLPDLATSLGALCQTLDAAGRHADAAEAAREGLRAIAPLVERLPGAFAQLTASLARDHLETCEKAGGEPDVELLQRVRKALAAAGAQTSAEG